MGRCSLGCGHTSINNDYATFMTCFVCDSAVIWIYANERKNRKCASWGWLWKIVHLQARRTLWRGSIHYIFSQVSSIRLSNAILSCNKYECGFLNFSFNCLYAIFSLKMPHSRILSSYFFVLLACVWQLRTMLYTINWRPPIDFPRFLTKTFLTKTENIPIFQLG